MGRRPVKDKRLPADYPQFAFRVSKEDKRRLTTIICETQDILNRRRKKGEPFFNKNDIIIRALVLGLKEIKRA